MPMVGGKKYPYTKKGKDLADLAQKRAAKKATINRNRRRSLQKTRRI